MNKLEKINLICNNLEKIGINIDCSRYEDSYGGYCDSRNWYCKYLDSVINLEVYLDNISESTLDKIIKDL